MNYIIANIPIFIIFLFLLTSFSLINYDFLTTNNKKRDIMKFYMYEVINIIFIIILIFYTTYHGYINGLYETLFTWAFLAICTPIPESGLLLSLPLKKYFNVRMVFSQIIISIISIVILILLYNTKCIQSLFIGKTFNNIITNGRYLIFVISIISSLIGTELIDNRIDKVLYNKTIDHFYLKMYAFTTLIILYFFV